MASRVLHVEMVGKGAVVEVGFEAHDRELRLPMKVVRSAEGWEVAWAPEPVYVEALINMSRSQTLPVSTSAQGWVEHQRLPSLPVILTRQQVVTPFGATELLVSETLTPAEALVGHVQRWVRDVLEDAPGPASVDLIADARVSWHVLHQTLMAPAALGLFRVHLITRGQSGQDLRVFAANLPVFASGLPRGFEMLTVGLYPMRDRWGVRIATGEGLRLPEEPCAPGMSVCFDENAAIASRVVSFLTEVGAEASTFTHLLFATPGTTSLEAAMPFLDALQGLVGDGRSYLFLGYIQR
jgi:hypothetical protein